MRASFVDAWKDTNSVDREPWTRMTMQCTKRTVEHYVDTGPRCAAVALRDKINDDVVRRKYNMEEARRGGGLSMNQNGSRKTIDANTRGLWQQLSIESTGTTHSLCVSTLL